jgi:capsular polysaccharide biosynthesis protein
MEKVIVLVQELLGSLTGSIIEMCNVQQLKSGKHGILEREITLRPQLLNTCTTFLVLIILAQVFLLDMAKLMDKKLKCQEKLEQVLQVHLGKV